MSHDVFSVKLLASGLARPVFVAAPPGDTKRLFIIEQRGQIRILDLTASPPALNPEPFLKLTGLASGNEQGLLGLAFHPDFSGNGLLYVNFTDATGMTVIRRFSVSATNRNKADPSTGQNVITVPQPFANHNGGWLAFGPDKMLYVALGDGGSANDPFNHAQDLGELLGKLLRIDIDGDDFPGDADRNYRIPLDNPFRATPGARPEIWAYGLRNPWRCDFDRKTGELYIADVGQDEWEEINVQPAGQGGRNYGWRVKEGKHETGLGPVAGLQLIDPIHEYDHNQGIAIVGGYVYRGSAISDLDGAYLFADATGSIWSLRHDGARVTELRDLRAELFANGGPSAISSFGEDASGELYIVNLMPGEIYQLVPQAIPLARATAAVAQPQGGRYRQLSWHRPTNALARAVAALAPATAFATPGAALPVAAHPITAAVQAIGFPEVPGVSAVEEARFLLQAAAEVEHALLVRYLYAMYSIDPSGGAAALAWVKKIRDIAKEEMGHLIMVQNLLLAIGGEPYFGRALPASFPASGVWDPFPFHLEPLTLGSLAKNVTAESPLPEQLGDEVRQRAEAAYRLANLAISAPPGGPTPAPPPVGVNHVGVLYARLYWLFQPNETPQGPWLMPMGPFPNRHLQPADFVGNLDRQAGTDETQGSSEEMHFNGKIYVRAIATAADALAALAFIAAEGEGWTMDPALESHFERFLAIFEEQARLGNAGWEPTLPVPTDPVTGDSTLPEPAEHSRITHPSSRMWAELFDTRYQMLIGELWLAMLLRRTDVDPTSKRSDIFGHAIYIEMKQAIARIARKLVTLPRKADAAGSAALRTAGPPFRLPDLASLPSDLDGWRQFLNQHIDSAGQLMAQLESPENPIPLTPPEKSLLNSLRTADTALKAAIEA